VYIWIHFGLEFFSRLATVISEQISKKRLKFPCAHAIEIAELLVSKNNLPRLRRVGNTSGMGEKSPSPLRDDIVAHPPPRGEGE